MKFFIAAGATLIASAAAGDWSQSCKEAKLDVTNEVLSASCNVGDGKGTFADTSLDLNDCLKYEDKKIKFGIDGHYGTDCNDCFLYELRDPWWPTGGATEEWMNCTCTGAGKEVAINLDNTPILNKYGKLQCIY